MLTDGQDPRGWPNARRPDWCREPEIAKERQDELETLRKIKPDVKLGQYPFAGVKLSRADVEYLLETHLSDGMTGPVNWYDGQHQRRDGLDLRGADLRSVDLSDLPLAKAIFSLNFDQWEKTTMAKTDAARAKLDGVRFDRAHLEGAQMVAINCRRGSLESAHMEKADLQLATFEQSWLAKVNLGNANLRLSRFLFAWLAGAHLAGANLHGASFDKATNLEGIVLGTPDDGYAKLTDVHWGEANLGVIDWARLPLLGEERESRMQQAAESGTGEHRADQLDVNAAALRGTRQLAIELRRQGLSDDADRFALRGYTLQRELYRRQRLWGRYFGSLLLAAVSGYGYRPIRSVATYAIIITGFAVAYYFLSASGPHLDPLAAIVFSITSFHGRGFSTSPGDSITLTSPLTVLAAVEAILGLFIEITFVATFTQRFFSR